MHKLLLGFSLVLILIFALAACDTGRQTENSGPIVVATTVSTVTPVLATASPTLAPTRPEPSATPMPPSPSPRPIQTDAQPPSTAVPATPTTEPEPTASPSSEPTLAPEPSPTPTLTALPGAGETKGLEDIDLALIEITSGLESPVGLANAGDGSDRLFIIEQKGRIRILHGSALSETPFLDLGDRVGSSQNEQGLLGLAFHPQYATNGLFFVNYTDLQGNTVVSRFAVSADPERGDPNSETILLTIPQPAGNHNGGNLAFGPDGYLYIGTGDGGAAGDKYGNGQNGATLLGAMLRIDVDHEQSYAIPLDNPFTGDPAVRDEIWAIGLRNPWRYSFDSLSGDLFIADVGQNRYEEINIQEAGSLGGQNYGWPIMEGVHCYPEDRACDQTGLTLPAVEYEHGLGCSVTGGYVYRGQQFPGLAGTYLFGDFCSGTIWGLASTGDGWKVDRLAQTDVQISSFGQDEVGELYLLGRNRGTLFKIAATASP